MKALFTDVNVSDCKEIQQFALSSNISHVSHNIDFSSVNATCSHLWKFFSSTFFEDLLMEEYVVFRELSEEKINLVRPCYTDMHWADALEKTID